ncbi:MAG: hypothetical protein JOZ75_13680 [Candidatus Dormibacteraeota bacterium]|nr:hypothetical protein [Candidatus Dormibacteraeota bacterium]
MPRRRAALSFVRQSTVAPGADATQLVMTFSGVTSMSTTRAGDLVLDTTAGVVVHHRPRLTQQFGSSA